MDCALFEISERDPRRLSPVHSLEEADLAAGGRLQNQALGMDHVWSGHFSGL